jgi:tagatose 1,6-diphosphate aldolase
LEDKGPEYAKLKPEVVADSMAEFSKDRYGVDVLKVEVPVNLQYVEGAKSFKGPKVYTKSEALQYFRQAAEATNKPFIYLSAGVSNPEFIEDLEFAKEAGVKFNGVLCGRATWKDGIPIFAEKGGKAFEAWLKDEGVKNIANVNNALKAATPWYSIYEVAEPALAAK